MYTLLGEHELSHSRVVEGDKGVGEHREFSEGGLRLVPPTLALEIERGGGKDHRKGPLFPGQSGHQGCRSRTGAASQAHADKDDLAVAQRVPNLQFRLLRSLITERRITSGSQSLGQVAAKLDLLRSDRTGQGSHIGIAGEELGSFHAIESDTVQHVGAGTSYSDYFDG